MLLLLHHRIVSGQTTCGLQRLALAFKVVVVKVVVVTLLSPATVRDANLSPFGFVLPDLILLETVLEDLAVDAHEEEEDQGQEDQDQPEQDDLERGERGVARRKHHRHAASRDLELAITTRGGGGPAAMKMISTQLMDIKRISKRIQMGKFGLLLHNKGQSSTKKYIHDLKRQCLL